MWEPSQATLDIGFCVHCGGKGTAPGCAHAVGAQRYQAAFTLLQLLDTADLPGTTALIVPTQCYQGMWKKTTQQWIGTGYSVCQTTQTTEAVGFWHEFQWLDWRYLSCGYLTSLVSCPLGPCGVATAAKEGGQIPGREPVLDGRGSGSGGHSQAMAGSSG